MDRVQGTVQVVDWVYPAWGPSSSMKAALLILDGVRRVGGGRADVEVGPETRVRRLVHLPNADDRSRVLEEALQVLEEASVEQEGY